MSADPPLRRPRNLPKPPADVDELTVGFGSFTYRRVDPLPPEEREAVSVNNDIDPALPRISIITCTHNRPDMLRGAAGSVRAQTRGDWEHLVADAGSMVPGADDALAEVAADPRAGVHRLGDLGDQPARAWNYLLDRARGKYISFLDDDNGLEPNYLEILAGVLDDHPETDVVTCGFIALEQGMRLPNHLNLQTGELIKRRNTVDTGCFMIRREAMERIGYFPEDIRTNEDWAMVRRMASCLRMEHRPECLMTYRVHEGQRMRRCEQLGNTRDKVKIEGSAWPGHIGVRVHAADGNASLRPLAEIPWVGDGPEIGIVFAGGDAARLVSAAEASKSLLILPGGGDVAAAASVAKKFCRDVWGLARDEGEAAALRAVVEGRVVTCGEALDRCRLTRVLNCVRSPRFGAVIP